MIVHLPDRWAVALSAAVWFLVSLVVGARAVRWSPGRLAVTGPFTTLRGWERSGAWWERHLRVGRWKDVLPEAGAVFSGGVSKRSVGDRTTDGLVRFRGETVRAERVHWLILGSTVVHPVWCRPALAAGMAVYGLVANVPFIVVQRFNRGRIDRVLARRRRRPR